MSNESNEASWIAPINKAKLGFARFDRVKMSQQLLHLSRVSAGLLRESVGGFCRLSPTALEKEEAAQNGKRIPKAKAPLGSSSQGITCRATHG